MPTKTDTQTTRHQALTALCERFIPENTVELLDADNIPAYALLARGREGDWVSLHENGQDALNYLAEDDSDYEPRLLVHLDTGEVRDIKSTTIYSIADATGLRVDLA